MKTQDIIDNNIFKTFLKYVSFNVISMLGMSLYVLADTFFIANGVGKEGLIVLNLALPAFIGGINALGLMLSMGVGTMYSIYLGKNEPNNANSVFTQVMILALFLGSILTVLGITYSKNIIAGLGASGDLIPLANEYIKTLFLFSFAFIFNHIIISMIRNDGNPKLAMIAMLTGSISNIILDYLFIFPLNMGMFGAALATGLAPIISLVILSSHIFTKKNNFKLIKTKVKRSELSKVVFIGIPTYITEFSTGIVLFVFNIVILRIIGDIGVAAYGILANISFVFIAIFIGIGQGIQPIISVSYGAGKMGYIKKILLYASYCTVLISCIFYIIFILYPDPIIAAFNAENDMLLHEIAKQGMRLYFPGFILIGLNIVIISFFSAIAKPRQSFIVSILRGMFLTIPAVLTLPHIWGINGVWLSVPIAELITLIIGVRLIYLYFRYEISDNKIC
ncbi:MATE family efflux transporter [Serpentinicella sp. ANB-PHB4]|uniref:MATE family efflux transporter n=1 Tax=Serpentinicella sp. ANB-PHB4 TaxID=3074076 RepID=UPI002858F816|nr:MATE family efflux transporter [Serpentinicella sp. ANB-PHB4]MDR5658448.1 MATE family efflux transporter [Serpentinicella sp. ANB-PHB4]